MNRRIFAVLLLSGAAAAQKLPPAPVSKQTWAAFAALGTEIVADGVTTRVLYQRHHDETDPLAKPFVHAGVPGQAAASLLGMGAAVGAWWLLRRSHGERMAHFFLWSATAVEGANDVREFALVRSSSRR
jgi:hypothetical protein